jgi:PAS domain S-box-containing protein
MKIVHAIDPDLPVLVVSGTVGEERAVEMMRAGASDYVLKDKLGRLGPALDREVREAENRKARTMADTALRASELRYRRLFEAAQDGVLIVDAASRQILDVNPFLANLLGYRQEDLVGKELWQIGLFHDIEANKAAFRTLQEVGYVRYDDYPLLAKDGRQIDAEFVSNTYDVNGVRKIQCNIRDITVQKRAVHALAASEERYRTLMAAMTAIVWNMPASGDFETEQPGWTAFTGQTFDELRGNGWLKAIHPEDRQNTAKVWTAAYTERIDYKVEHRLRRADGAYRQMAVRAMPIFEASGAVREWVGVHTDMTDQRRAEEAVRASEERFRAFMDHSPAAADIKDAEGRLLYVNAAWRRQFAPEPIDWQGKTNYDYWPRETADLFGLSDLRCLAENAAIEVEEAAYTASHEERIFLVMKVPFLDGGLRRIGGMAWDITDRVHAEAALRLRDRAIQAATQGITITDAGQADNPVIYVSPSFERITGYKPEQVLGRNLRFLQGPDTDPAVVARLRAAVAAGEPCSVEFRNYRNDGTPFWNALSISPVRDAAGHLTHFVGVQADVTGRRDLEEQFRQAQKMEAFGQLAGGVAHDFNNLLTIINGYGDIVLRGLAPDDKLRGFVKEIIIAGERSAALTAQLLAFSRKQVVVLKVLDLNTVVLDTEKMLRRIIGEDIDLVTSLAEDTGAVRADSGQLEQVLLNLAVNARDAMPQGGKLTIETKNVELGNGQAKLHLDARPGSYVLLAASDTGCGMTEEVKKRIFEPFFTTKGVGGGTGLGLATVFGIVSQADGHVEVFSEVNVGTSFKIYLPRLNKAVKPRSHSHMDTIPRGTESILLVEDEVGLRGLLHQVLNACGYAVSAAASGIKALQLAQEHIGLFDLIVTDVVMPGMSGRQMVEQLVARYPKAKVIYMSGYTDDAVIRHGILHEQAPYLQKPFSPAKLAIKVREVLDS